MLFDLERIWKLLVLLGGLQSMPEKSHNTPTEEQKPCKSDSTSFLYEHCRIHRDLWSKCFDHNVHYSMLTPVYCCHSVIVLRHYILESTPLSNDLSLLLLWTHLSCMEFQMFPFHTHDIQWDELSTLFSTVHTPCTNRPQPTSRAQLQPVFTP